MSRMDRYHGKGSHGKKRDQYEDEIYASSSKRQRKRRYDDIEETRPRKSKVNKKPKKKRTGLKVFITILVLALIGGAGYFYYMGLQTGIIKDPTGGGIQKEYFPNNTVNILFLGADKREGEDISRSDTIIVGSFDFNTGEVRLLSIPRDTRVPIPGYGEDKINHAYAYGGKELVDETIEEFYGITVDRVVEIDFETFKDAVDKVGGVTIEVDEEMYKPSENIDLQPGLQVLDGYNALAFVRYRDYVNGDIGRVEHQQKFLQALGTAVKNNGNVFTQIDVVSGIYNDLTTDVSLEEMMYMFGEYRDKSFKISTYTAPGTPEMIDGVSYVIPDEDAPELVQGYFAGLLVPVTDSETGEKVLVTKEEADQISEETQEILLGLPPW